MSDDPRREGGFTLVELLTVIVIIAVLAAMAIPMFLNQREKGYRATVASDLRSVQTAQIAVMADDISSNYTEDVTQLMAAGYNRSPGIAELVIDVDGGYYLACVRHQALSEWLVLDSAEQSTEWSPTNACG